ncbi:MAG: GntR family transcriptional regulator [Clostridia bacterium]|nr:GntR family transcriptional regulator [Clostridia bacterium]
MGVIMVDVKSRIPIYEQIIASVKQSVLDGIFSTDESLPSVRSLARELAINPNTIQKAYAELERQGIVYSVPGRGCFISSDTEKIEKQHRSQLESNLKALMREAIRAGIDVEEIKAIAIKIKEETLNDPN